LKVLIVGIDRPGQIGSYFASAAAKRGLSFTILDSSESEARSRVARSLYWRLAGKRPARLREFGTSVVNACSELRPDLVLTTGRAPLERPQIEKLQCNGAIVVNYSTDDPWNPMLLAPWFLSVIPAYDAIFTPRRANLEDFRRFGAQCVHYIPFGYDPDVHLPWPNTLPAGKQSDVLFVGGCDADRLPLISALIHAGLTVALYGGYWGRHGKTRPFWRGLAEQDVIRSASASALISLCLVRRANRDGNVMRSYEAAAIGGCILAEDTSDHRELFGDAARFFTTEKELVDEAQRLVCESSLRDHLRLKLKERISHSCHTYADRLASMIHIMQSKAGRLTS